MKFEIIKPSIHSWTAPSPSTEGLDILTQLVETLRRIGPRDTKNSVSSPQHPPLQMCNLNTPHPRLQPLQIYPTYIELNCLQPLLLRR
jgi:hypothetical protein